MIERTPEKQLDLLIVVDQMLTGFDSKWVNTLYMDKMLEYENIIQAFSRTNRLFVRAGVVDFAKLPDDRTERGKFALLYKELNDYLEAARIQGFRWDIREYEFTEEESGRKELVKMEFDETIYLILAQRYKELSSDGGGSAGGSVPYDLVGHLTEINTGVNDAEYMNSRFEKYMKLINQEGAAKLSIDEALSELHKTFAALTREEQKYADIFLHDIQRGDVQVEEGKAFRDYVIEYQCRAKDAQIHRLAKIFGLYEEKLRNLMSLKLTEANINEFGRFDELIRTDKLLREFILCGGFEIEEST